VRGFERSEARAVQEVSQGAVPFEDGLDTMLDCVELTKETLQREALYI